MGIFQQLIDQGLPLVAELLNIDNDVVNLGTQLWGAQTAITNTINSGISGVRSKIDGVRDHVTARVNGAIQTVRDVQRNVTTSVSGMIGSATDTISNFVSNIGTSISGSFSRGIDTLADTIGAIVVGIADLVRGGIQFARDAVNSTIFEVRNSISKVVVNMRSIVSEAIHVAQSLVNSAIATTRDTVRSAISSAQDNISSVAQTVRDAISSVVATVGDNIRTVYQQGQSAVAATIALVREGIERTQSFVATATTTATEAANRAIQDAYNRVADLLGDIIERIDRIWGEIQEIVGNVWDAGVGSTSEELTSILPRFGDVFTKLLTNRYDSWQEFFFDIESAGGNSRLLRAALMLAVSVPLVASAAMAASGPIVANLETLSMVEARPANLGPDTLIPAYYRGQLSQDDYLEGMAKQGFHDDLSILIAAVARPLLREGELRNLWLRGTIDETAHDDRMQWLGWDSHQLNLLKSLYYFIPPPQDLITMAVREVFSPATAEAFGQYEDFPEEFARFAGQQGVSREWAERYWAAHWSLPSPQMGFEMLQRGIITRPELEMLLKALDIMPFWRDRLIALSYNPLTRVDTRRMYDLGVLDREGVKASYRELGYDETNAERMTEFTIRYVESGEADEVIEVRSLTRSVIERAYKYGQLTRQQAISELSGLGYERESADLLLSIVDYTTRDETEQARSEKLIADGEKLVLRAYERRALPYDDALAALDTFGLTEDQAKAELTLIDYEFELSIKEEVSKKVRTMFIERTVDQIEARDILSRAGFDAAEVDRILEEVLPLYEVRDRKPTQAQFEAWVKAGYISPEQYAAELAGLGFPNKYIVLYLAEIGVT